MNLEDVIDPEYGLQQDEWSLTNPRFGEEGQLEIVGWSGKSKGTKFYIIKCSKCSEDRELFGEGLFKTRKNDILRNMIPCGCSPRRLWSKSQYQTLCKRKASELGFKFVGFCSEFNGRKTKIKMLCEKHGEWDTGNISNLMKGNKGCPACGRLKSADGRRTPIEDRLAVVASVCEGTTCSILKVPEHYTDVFCNITMTCSLHGNWETTMKSVCDGNLCFQCAIDYRAKLKTVPDNVMISKFFSTGAFSEGTVFTKIGMRDNGKAEWEVFCPDCQEKGLASLDNLQQGKRPCACSNMRQKQAYINWVVDDGNVAVALKFGIAINSRLRTQAQNKKSTYEVRNYLTYSFPDTASCKAAERECKQTLECGVVSFTEMSDGYTETTSTYNLVKIKQIYEKHGGVPV